MRPQQTPEKLVPLDFPIGGNDSSNEYARQPQLTTLEGINCRAYDVLELRRRGGSRHGISRFVDDFVDTPNSPVQSLGLVILIADDAVNVDDDDDMMDDPSTNNRRRRKPVAGRRIRRRGSGRRPTRNGRQKVAPVAVNNTATVFTGDSVTISILSNDVYTGTPKVTVKNPPPIPDGGTMSITGKGANTQIVFNAGSAEATYSFEYILQASGNRGSSRATVTITITDTDFPPESYPQTYTARVLTINAGDGSYELTFDQSADGLPVGPGIVYFFTANGPGTGEEGATNFFIDSVNELDGVTVGGNVSITVSGTYDIGYSATAEVL